MRRRQAGSRSTASVPPPGRGSSRAEPPWAVATARTIASPSPDAAAPARGVGAAEALERAPGELGRDAGAAVGDHELDPAVARPRGQRRPARRRGAARCRRGWRAPAPAAPRSPRSRTGSPGSTASARPASAAGPASRSRTVSSRPAASSGSICSSRCPASARAITSRSSASRLSRTASSSAAAIVARSSSGERSRRRATSSSPRRMASGVRSSWLASAANARSASSACSSRPEHRVERAPEPVDLVVVAGHGQPLRQRAVGDLRGAAAHPLDRAQRGRDGEPARERRARAARAGARSAARG